MIFQQSLSHLTTNSYENTCDSYGNVEERFEKNNKMCRDNTSMVSCKTIGY